MILDDIAEKRKEQLARDMAAITLTEVRAAAEEAAKTDTGRSFKNALTSLPSPAIIAEVKKASPSKGIISEDFRPAEQAEAYQKAGAAAVSCLTEEYYFKGSAEYFKAVRKVIDIPMIRKDFIIDPYQIYEAKAMGADAILLIAAILDTEQMKEYREIAENLKMDVLAESHNEEELTSVINAGCTIFGINNRNLKDFSVTLDTTKRLAGLVPNGSIIVAESGIKTAEDMKFLADCGANAVLIGETLMRSPDKKEMLANLKGE
ncbi:MAG: indole-3-glycerol phosphate synthase TrpC [Oscillospiraceae bacterium]|nr:indole-3-glycerol phosphate synthase TrpC [Oscillospiraceae bacterium]